MAILESEVDVQSQEFRDNAEVMQAAIDEFRTVEKTVLDTAEGKSDRYRAKGYMPPRERLGQLLPLDDGHAVFVGHAANPLGQSTRPLGHDDGRLHLFRAVLDGHGQFRRTDHHDVGPGHEVR